MKKTILKNKKTNVVCYFNQAKLSNIPVEDIPYWKLYTKTPNHFINDATNYFTYREVLGILRDEHDIIVRAQPRSCPSYFNGRYKLEVHQYFDDGTENWYNVFIADRERAKIDFEQIQILSFTESILLYDMFTNELIDSYVAGNE